jgi:hypothetical protein
LIKIKVMRIQNIDCRASLQQVAYFKGNYVRLQK